MNMAIDVSMAINVMIDIMTYVVSSSLSLLPRLTLPAKSNHIKSTKLNRHHGRHHGNKRCSELEMMWEQG